MSTENFCNNYVKQIFKSWDVNENGLLERSEIKSWLNKELLETPLSHTQTRKGMADLVAKSDTNRDGKIDRWELFSYCLMSYQPEDD